MKIILTLLLSFYIVSCSKPTSDYIIEPETPVVCGQYIESGKAGWKCWSIK